MVDARRAYAYSKVGTAACGRDGVAGLDLPGCSLLLRSFPHSHYSGSFAGSCVEDPYDVDIVCNGYGLLRICCLALELHRDLSRSLPPRPAERRAGEHSAPRLQQNTIEQRFTSTLQGIHLPGCHEAPAQTAGTAAKPADRVFRTCPDAPETRLPFLPQPHQTPRSLHLLRCGGTSWGYSSLWQSDNIILQNYIYRHSTKMLLSVSEELRKKRLKNLSF